MHRPDDTRQRLAALITAPANRRFSRVIVNHFFKRLIGAGIVQPVHDWEGKRASHPEMLDWLASELVSHDYDERHVMRLIMTSDLYQRVAVGRNRDADADMRFFCAPEPRRLSAEQIVDSMFSTTGRRIDCEELTFVHDGVHPGSKRLTLGRPQKAWMFASLNNERDRPSLALPRAQSVVDVLEAFGWVGSRQKPIAEREVDPNVLQPGILANGTLTASLTRATWKSELAEMALQAGSAETLVDDLFLRFLSRRPKDQERRTFVAALQDGFDSRRVDEDQIDEPQSEPRLPQVTWTNHLLAEANEIQIEIQQRVRRGPHADPRLDPQWRGVFEDVVWSLINHREFAWMP